MAKTTRLLKITRTNEKELSEESSFYTISWKTQIDLCFFLKSAINPSMPFLSNTGLNVER